jgi:hypothetical protein
MYSAPSTGSHKKYMKYVIFPRPLLVAAHERKGLPVALHSSGKLLAAEKLSLHPGKGKAVPLQAWSGQEVKVPRLHDNGTGWW